MSTPNIRYFIHPGLRERTVLVHTVTDARTIPAALEESGVEEPLPNAAVGAVLAAFLRGVEVGCLGPVAPSLSLELHQVRHTETPSGEEEMVWSVVLPRLSPGALAVLGHMLAASVALGSGLVRASIEEESITQEAAPELSTLPQASPPFRTLFPEPYFCKELRLLMVFRRALSEADVSAVRHVLAAWESILIGGFPAPGLRGLSMVSLHDVSSHLDEEITGTLEMFTGGKEAWDALARAGMMIHRDIAPLEALEVA
ncbi:hypothetical protein [Sorangium sp. So ce1182]|uniref:hypothetical protein n=1 Tax=Sorangium sp. So ce1182 TaxID=3133334 RepID=UPI003F63C917